MKTYSRDVAETLRVKKGMAASARYIQSKTGCRDGEAVRLMLQAGKRALLGPAHPNCRSATVPLTDTEAQRLLEAFRAQYPDLKAFWSKD